jgi:acyl-CoA dehydrogenase
MKLFDRTVLALPFYEERHRRVAERVEALADDLVPKLAEWESSGPDEMGRQLTGAIADTGLFAYASSSSAEPDFRAIALIREGLAQVHDLCDFAFATQALGAAAVVHYGSPEQRTALLPDVVAGRRIGSLAISEPEVGSDAAAVVLRAERRGDVFVLDGEKTWIANATIAHYHTVLVRTGEGPGMLGLSVLLVPSDSSGLTVEPIATIAPRAFGRLLFRNCTVPVANVVGKPGRGFQVAMEVLDRYRLTVGAAAVGFARRALAAGLEVARTRRIKTVPLFDMQATQLKLADAGVGLAAGALLVARAAWELDCGSPTYAVQSSIAKLHATEAAQRIVDDVVQLHGAAGVVHDSLPERLYRQVRSLRIYEGTSEIQRFIIAGELRRADVGARA